MGLKEKQAMSDLIEKDIPRYEARIKENGLAVTLKVDWATVPENNLEAIARCKTLLGEFSTRFWDLGQNKIAKAEVEKKIHSVLIRHDSSEEQEYEFKLLLKGDVLEFSANLTRFTLTQSSKRPTIQSKIEELL